MPVAVNFRDNKAATRVGGLNPPANDSHAFDLGEIDGVNIGSMFLVRKQMLADGSPVGRIYRGGVGAAWIDTSVAPDVHVVAPAYQTTWGEVATGPVLASVYTMPFAARAAVRRADELPTAGEIPLDGSVTIRMAYP